MTGPIHTTVHVTDFRQKKAGFAEVESEGRLDMITRDKITGLVEQRLQKNDFSSVDVKELGLKNVTQITIKPLRVATTSVQRPVRGEHELGTIKLGVQKFRVSCDSPDPKAPHVSDAEKRGFCDDVQKGFACFEPWEQEQFKKEGFMVEGTGRYKSSPTLKCDGEGGHIERAFFAMDIPDRNLPYPGVKYYFDPIIER